MNRRDLLKAAATLFPMVVAGRAFAAPAASGTRLLVVFLRGAYDAANVIVQIERINHELRRAALRERRFGSSQ